MTTQEFIEEIISLKREISFSTEKILKKLRKKSAVKILNLTFFIFSFYFG